ncbi:DUF397 domain-containing protein [Streptomyces buecherae]|uniref:DUF397 domain-containing protein n=1 Tax=Streptomyces buecherae TaxID=2763006 RepID=UPI00340BB31F
MTHKWIKSSYSSPNGGECIEWAPAHAAATRTIPVRDSKDPHGPTLTFDTAAWNAFVTGVKNGDFDA